MSQGNKPRQTRSMLDFVLNFDRAALDLFTQSRKGITPTQWAALEKGTVGFEGSVFAGQPDWEGLRSTPAPKLSAAEQSFFDNEVETFCAMIDDWKIRDELHDLPPEAWDYAKKNKFFGMCIPKEYGGLGFSSQGHAAVISKIASRSATATVTVMVPNSLGPGELLMHYGTEAQKNHYLPRLADGREIPCFALTSPQAGSDATNQRDEGTVFRGDDGKAYIRLNWDKRYTTLAPVATVIGVAFKLYDPEHLLGNRDDIGLTLALVDAGAKGVSRDQRHRPAGSPFQNGPHWGKDVVIPAEDIIGGPEEAGNGWNMLVDCLSIGRSISLPSGASGASRKAVRVTGAYAAIRQQFRTPLAAMEGIQEPLAAMGGLTYMIEAARMLPLQDMDLAAEKGESARPAVASAILKYHLTEAARKVAIAAMDVHGGKAVMEGPDNPVNDFYQSIPVSITVEGANILTRNLMIFGQGAFMAHPYILKEMQTAESGDAKQAGKLLRQHMAHTFNNAARGLFHGLTHGVFAQKPVEGPEARYYQHINRLSAGFAFVADTSLLVLGNSLMRKERTSARLGDVFSNLYLASQVLRRFELEGRHADDVPLMQWAAEHCLHEAESAMSDLIDNHPSKLVRHFMKPIVLPLGARLNKPSDRLEAKVADLISRPGPARDRLTAGIFMPQDERDYLNRLERALTLTTEAKRLEETLYQAAKLGRIARSEKFEDMIRQGVDRGLITDAGATILADARTATDDIVKVNHFPKEWQGKPQSPA